MNSSLLLVEDGDDDVLFMARAFKKAGLPNVYQVVEDGRKAIDYLSGQGPYADRLAHPMPRLVLLDLKLPLISGFDVLRWVRAQPSLIGLVVVMLTSSDHSSDIRDAYALGANSYLSKPASPEDLTDLVRDVVNYWLKRNLTPDGRSDNRGQPAG
jgi:CheY-like chemotaxis protein